MSFFTHKSPLIVLLTFQIDRIQLAIRETKDGRTAAIKDGSESKPSAAFEGLDERLQALAVLMLHYCSALQVTLQ